MITKNDLVDLVVGLAREVECEDPIDWGMLAVDEDTTYRLMASQIVEHFFEGDLSQKAVTITDREMAMLSSITKLIVENFVLNLHLDHQRGIHGNKAF